MQLYVRTFFPSFTSSCTGIFLIICQKKCLVVCYVVLLYRRYISCPSFLALCLSVCLFAALCLSGWLIFGVSAFMSFCVSLFYVQFVVICVQFVAIYVQFVLVFVLVSQLQCPFLILFRNQSPPNSQNIAPEQVVNKEEKGPRNGRGNWTVCPRSLYPFYLYTIQNGLRLLRHTVGMDRIIYSLKIRPLVQEEQQVFDVKTYVIKNCI